MAKRKSTKTESTDDPKIGVSKFLQITDLKIHVYTRAALEVDYHDIMMSESEWKDELAEYAS